MGEAVDAALPDAADFIERDPVDAAERDVADQQIPGEGAVWDGEGLGGGVGDFVVGEPHGGRRRRLIGEETRAAAVGGGVVMAVEFPRLEMVEAGRRHP